MTYSDAPTTPALDADEVFRQLESGNVSDDISRMLLGSLKNIIITRAREIVAQGAEEASYWPQMFYGTGDWLRMHASNPYNWTLRKVHPVNEDGAIGAALVFTDGHPDHPDIPEFRLVTLRYYAHAWIPVLHCEIPVTAVTQVSLLSSDNLEHLRLIWDVTRRDL